MNTHLIVCLTANVFRLMLEVHQTGVHLSWLVIYGNDFTFLLTNINVDFTNGTEADWTRDIHCVENTPSVFLAQHAFKTHLFDEC